jgi:ABC-type transport system involved in multi-copper enzyme maturation permease subunit
MLRPSAAARTSKRRQLMLNLLGRLLARNRVFLLACALVLGWFQFLLCALVAELDLQSALEQILAFAPPIMRGVVEQALLGGSVQGVLAFGWDHPITHALVTAVAIALAARAIAGEVESGVIELVLAQPLGRASYLGAHLVFGLGGMAFVLAAGGLGTTIGQEVFSLHAFASGRLLPLLFNVLLLQTAIFSLTLLVSAWGREAGRVAVIGVLLAVVSYFINVIASFWPRAAFLQPWSLHSYYDPRAILVRGEVPATAFVALAAITVAATSLACWRFQRRDLP